MIKKENVPQKWQWLFEPLSPVRRKRLELALGVVLTAGAVVAMSTAIRPDPSKLVHPITVGPTTSIAERRAEAHLKPEEPATAAAKVLSPDFVTAVSHGDLATLDRLHTPDMPLKGMLAVAAETGMSSSAKWLLDHGADVHEGELTIDAPVLIGDEHPYFVMFLRGRGAAEPSLTTAAEAGARGAVFRHLASQTPVNAIDKDTDATPLYAAVSSTRATDENRKIIVDALLDAGADPNRDEIQTPLGAAVRLCEPTTEEHGPKRGCLALVKLLVKKGARARGDAIVATLSVDDSMQDDVVDAVLAARLERGATATALAQAGPPSPRTMKRLLAKGVEWSWHDGEDDAALPLLSAVQRGDRDFVRTLLDAGAPADARFKDGWSPLSAAIDASAIGSADAARIVDLLLARGVDVNRRLPDGRTPLFAAAEAGSLRVVTALLDRGARVNDVVLDDTALDVAEQNSHVPVARVLHARGARRARKSPYGSGVSDP